MHDWAEAILDLAGWVVDMAVALDTIDEDDTTGKQWLMRNSIGRYQQATERLRKIEKG